MNKKKIWKQIRTEEQGEKCGKRVGGAGARH